MKSSREQFEEWYSKASGLCDIDLESEFNVDDNGEYIYSGASDAWAAWQASRAAIEITLPDCDDYQSTWQYQDAAEVRIKEQGVSVK